MPKIPIDECPAGPAMDAAVAEALGCNVVVKRYKGRWVAFCNCKLCEHDSSGMLSRYSTDIAAAWELWELLSKRKPYSWALYSEGEEVTIEYYGDDYIGELEAGCGDWQRGGKAPFAITRAFLKANGVEYIEVSE